MNDTKERILLTALQLFAKGGYAAVSVSDIAGELGITKGALYRHYQNKRDIFSSIVARMEQRDAEQASTHGVTGGTLEETQEAYRDAEVDHIIGFSKAMFRYWTEDDFPAQFRRLLTLEQFHSVEMGELYQQYLVSGPLGYMTDLFDSLGFAQPRREAVTLYAPMFLLYSVYDGAEDKKAVLTLADELLEQARIHLKGTHDA